MTCPLVPGPGVRLRRDRRWRAARAKGADTIRSLCTLFGLRAMVPSAGRTHRCAARGSRSPKGPPRSMIRDRGRFSIAYFTAVEWSIPSPAGSVGEASFAGNAGRLPCVQSARGSGCCPASVRSCDRGGGCFGTATRDVPARSRSGHQPGHGGCADGVPPVSAENRTLGQVRAPYARRGGRGRGVRESSREDQGRSHHRQPSPEHAPSVILATIDVIAISLPLTPEAARQQRQLIARGCQ